MKGSVNDPKDVVAREDVLTKDQLEWKSSKYAWRAEGYAVFWRNTETKRFTMRAAGIDLSDGAWKVKKYKEQVSLHVIELSLNGRLRKITGGPAGVQADEGFDPKKAALPIIGFHAPSKEPLARMGTYLSGLAEQLYAVGPKSTAHEKVVAGGDYNVDSRKDKEWPEVYVRYCRQTTIAPRQLSANGKRTGPPIISTKTEDYYHRTIDNIFFRGSKNPFAYAVLIPQRADEGRRARHANGAVFPHLQKIALAAGAIDANRGPWNWEGFGVNAKQVPLFPSMTDWNGFLTGVQQGFFTGDPETGVGDARNASMLTHDLVGDHLPVVVEFDVA